MNILIHPGHRHLKEMKSSQLAFVLEDISLLSYP